MKHEEATKLVMMLITAFPVPAWPDETLDLWSVMLTDLEFGAATHAVRGWILSRRDRPTIAEIRDAVRSQLVKAEAIPGELESDEAWGYVVRCFRDVGSYRDFPQQPYPLVAEVVARLGWQTLCLSENQIADRAHFLRIYEAALLRDRSTRLQAPSLRHPDDAQRLAAAQPQVESPKAKLEPKTQMLRLSDLTASVKPMEFTKREPEAIVMLVEPTDAEIKAAAERKAALRAQLRGLDGTA